MSAKPGPKPDGVPNRRYCSACRRVFPNGGLIRVRHPWPDDGPRYFYNCRACRDQIYREFRPAPKYNVHYVWHEFCRKFQAKEDGYKLTGYALMCAVEKWAERYPRDVFVVGCDDDSHSCSDLVVIEHRSRTVYMGATVVYIPQLHGAPAEFFLYPGERQGLIEVLGKLGRKGCAGRGEK